MTDILKNFNEAASGNKPSAVAETGSMKAILESLNKVTESKIVVDECGDMPMTPTPADSGSPVSMNVNLTASGKDNVEELMSLIKAVSGIEQHTNMPSAHDNSHGMDVEMPGADQEMDMATMRQIMAAGEEEKANEEWDNGPEEEYKDTEYMTKDIAGGINRPKKSYKPTNGGDNPMALESSIKNQLWAALQEKKKR